jgi:hypothetical protein
MAKRNQYEQDSLLKKVSDGVYMFEAKAPIKPPLATITKNSRYNVLDFGRKNNFPQELIRAINSSPTARACTKSHAKFIAGDGFIFPELDINDANYKTFESIKKWLTPEFLQRVAYDYTYFEAISIHMIFNLNGDLVSAKHVDTSTVRLSEPDDNGVISKCKISPDWENTTGIYANINRPVEYDLYDPIHTRETIASMQPDEFQNWGGAIAYFRRYAPGQPYYVTPSWSSSLNYVYTDGQIQDFHANNIDNAFMPSVLFFVPGEIKGEVEIDGVKMPKKDAFKKYIEEKLSGAENAGKPAIVYGPDGSQPTITQFNANTNHELFITLEKLITEAITRAFQIPQVLAGIKTSGQLGTSNEIANAIELYYNTVIKDDVNFVESIIDLLTSLWVGYTKTDARINIANSKPFNFIDPSFKDDFAVGERRESAGYSWEKPAEDQPNIVIPINTNQNELL